MKDITFDGIKNSLIEYYSSQETFKDFNWTAPAITTLIDAQAYLAHYLCVYSGFALNEVFLDTAQKRSSVVSKARNIGYRPAQYKGAYTKIKMEYIGSVDIEDFAIPAGTQFSATSASNTYLFRTKEAFPIQKTSTGRYWAQVVAYEGQRISNRWTQANDSSTRFILSNPEVDIDTIEVTVYNNEADSVGTKFTELESLSQFGPKAALYTIEENTDGNVELIFGDGILSKSIKPGNIVVCAYDAVAGSAANNIVSFQLVSIPNSTYDTSLWKIVTLDASMSGSDRESIDSIRLNAPRFFQRQGRDVVADDYKSDILRTYGGIIDSLSVWGGENNVPPEYGTVFVSVKPKGALSLTNTQKEDIKNHLLKSAVVCISPKIVNPVIIYVNMNLDVTYNPVYSSNTVKSLTSLLTDKTKTYFNDFISSYNVNFKYSKFLAEIFSVDDTISDVNTSIQFYQYMFPTVNAIVTYVIDFKNKLEKGSVFVGPFNVYGQSASSLYMKDDSNGTLYVWDDNKADRVGTVDYDAGTVTIRNYNFKSTVGEMIPVYANPANKNMSVSHNYIFSVDNVSIKINNGS
mgnify:CR=1 FL=1